MDPRAEQGEVKSREAERKERRGQFQLARSLYREAGDAFASVAISVPNGCPNMRSDLAIAAVACLGRGGDFGRAVELALRFLAEPGGLSKRGIAELSSMAEEYAALASAVRHPTRRAPAGEARVRGDVRHRFDRTS